MDQTSINNFIMTDINLHMKSFYQRGKLGKTENRLNEIVDREVIDLTKKNSPFSTGARRLSSAGQLYLCNESAY